MPVYTYTCSECKETWDDLKTLSSADAPTEEPCPKCGKVGCVGRESVYSTSLSADNTLTPDKATGGKWNELMSRMKNSAGVRKVDADRLDISSSRTGRRWKT